VQPDRSGGPNLPHNRIIPMTFALRCHARIQHIEQALRAS